MSPLTRQQKVLANAIIKGMDYRDLTQKWMLDKIKTMLELSPKRSEITEPIQDMYEKIKNMSKEEWDDMEALMPFVII